MTTVAALPAPPAAEPEVLRALATKRACAGVLFLDRRRRVLLVEPTYKPYWDLPGGCVEPGESPRRAAGREVWEELRLTPCIGRLLVVDFVPPRPDLSEALAFVFDGGRLPTHATPVLDPAELRSWAWCTPQEMAPRLEHAPMLARRIDAAVRAKTFGFTIDLESGHGH